MFGHELFITQLPQRMRRVFRGNVAHAIKIADFYSGESEQVQMLKEFGEVQEVTSRDFFRIVRRDIRRRYIYGKLDRLGNICR